MVMKRKERYEAVKNSGKCVNCGNVRDGKSKCLCSSCIEKSKGKSTFYQRHRREIFKNMGVCRHCGKTLIEGSTYFCKKCIEYNRERGRIYVNSQKGKFQRKLNHHITKFKSLQIVSKQRIPCCSFCGISDMRILTINHNNGKNEFDKKFKNNKGLGYKTMYRDIINGKRKTNDLSVLCYNCNILFDYEYRKTIGIDN